MAKKTNETLIAEEPKELLSNEEAKMFFDSKVAEGIYIIPEGHKVAYVCQDKNVFYDEQAARTWVNDVEHNKKKRPLLFTVECL
jgi:hypothetical protein